MVETRDETVIVEQSWWNCDSGTVSHRRTVKVEQSWWNTRGGTVIMEQ